jgi:hypothetical protein
MIDGTAPQMAYSSAEVNDVLAVVRMGQHELEHEDRRYPARLQ